MINYDSDNGMSITNVCYECMIISRDIELGHPTGKCQTCMESAEARSDVNAWNLRESDRLGEGKSLLWDEEEPSGHDWVSSEVVGRDGSIREEFAPPTYNILDGGVLDNLYELDSMSKRHTECGWCHLLTPKAFNDCQSCDKPLELNVR